MLPRRPAQLVSIALVFLGASALAACSAEPEDARGTSTGVPGGLPGTTPPGGVAPGGTAGSASGSGPFSNPTRPPPNLPMGTAPGGGKCLEATVAFVVDGSGSMCEVFGASTRWQELRRALLDPATGLLYRLQGTAKFGMMLYDGSIDLALAGMAAGTPQPACAGMSSAGRLMATDCMQVATVLPALGNADAIAAAFPMRELGGSTPTDRALNLAVDGLIAGQAGVDLTLYPQFIVLATDGQPNDICVGGLGGDGMPQKTNVVLAVDRAAAAGIKTFVISLAGGDPALQMHLDEVARHGNPADPAARTFTPANPEELVAALVQVLGNALGCRVD